MYPLTNTVVDPPIVKTTTYNITSFSVSVLSLELFKSVTLSIVYYADKGVVDTELITLKDQAYMDWNNNDQYIIDYVKNNINK
jgi:hypothetical protein